MLTPLLVATGYMDTTVRRDLRPRLYAGPKARDASPSSRTLPPARDGAARVVDLTAGVGGCEAHRRAVRHRARDLRRDSRGAHGRAPGTERAAGCGTGRRDAHRARRALAPGCRGQGDRLQFEALGTGSRVSSTTAACASQTRRRSECSGRCVSDANHGSSWAPIVAVRGPL